MVNNKLVITKSLPFAYVSPELSESFARYIYSHYEDVVSSDFTEPIPNREDLAGEDDGDGLLNILENDIAIDNYGVYYIDLSFETDEEYDELYKKIIEQEKPFWHDVRMILYQMQVPFFDWEKDDKLVNPPIVGVW